MTGGDDPERAGVGISRRRFLAGAGSAAAGAAVGIGMGFGVGSDESVASGGSDTVPFHGLHQAGVTTPPQASVSFGSFDLTTTRRSDLIDLLRTWTSVSARLTAGVPAAPPIDEASTPPADSGEALSLPVSKVTVTVGFGASLFETADDRFGLSGDRPGALTPLPIFAGDQLQTSSTGGDLTVQVCADEPQVASHGLRQLAREARGVAVVRWSQTGFRPVGTGIGTPRNLLGFKDGTVNPDPSDDAVMDRVVWAGSEGPAWMRGGTYQVVRQIQLLLADWDGQTLDKQERSIGRHKVSGAPLGAARETDPLDLDALDVDLEPIIPLNAHVRRASPQQNDGATILRRSYNYDNGPIGDVGPSGNQAHEAGLLFICYQRDPRNGFTPIAMSLAGHDELGTYVTHTGSVLAAVPPGITSANDWFGRLLLAE